MPLMLLTPTTRTLGCMPGSLVFIMLTLSLQVSVSAQRVEFFHVHWLQTDGTIASGTSVWGLEHIHFVPNDTGASFGFVHPSHAIRACHLIPAFRHGRTLNYLPSSFACDPKGNWRYYTINQYAYAFLPAQFLTSDFFQICRLGHVCPIPWLWYWTSRAASMHGR